MPPQLVLKEYGGAAAAAVNISWPGDFYYVWAVPKAEVDKNPNLQKTPGWIY